MSKYKFFGELGYLTALVMPHLEIFLQENNEKITILTNSDYATIMQLYFKDLINIEIHDYNNKEYIRKHYDGINMADNKFEDYTNIVQLVKKYYKDKKKHFFINNKLLNNLIISNHSLKYKNPCLIFPRFRDKQNYKLDFDSRNMDLKTFCPLL
jgi:hypothetical protein